MKLLPISPRLYSVPFENVWYGGDPLDILIPVIHPHPNAVVRMTCCGIYHDGAWYVGSGKGQITGEWFGVWPDGEPQPPWSRR